MAIVNEIKCARCDRKYSGVRSRCPYCGARRIGRGKYSEGSDNAKGKMLISVLIMAVFAVAAAVLLFTTPIDAEAIDPEDDPAISTDPEADINSEPGVYPEETSTPPPVIPEEPEVILEVTSITITYGGSPLQYGNEFSIKVGERIELGARIEPPSVEATPEWSSSDEEIFAAVPVVGGVAVTGIGVGNATLIVEAGDKVVECTVRVTR